MFGQNIAPKDCPICPYLSAHTEAIVKAVEEACLKKHKATDWVRDEPCKDCDSFEMCRISHSGRWTPIICEECSDAIVAIKEAGE